ncbi:MAG TPA: glycerol-3-phosphate dehydrogenase/oxidase [Actinomycetota bacterium]|nr:glycerol-3-phosphate dehydrogenase/oxidase [Actinomycetota bacterium]
MLAFSGETRRTALQRMAESELDVLVIGGGITGCGVALDAVSRGLSVGLVEKEDFASGTSGRSSRLIHGGMRYLQHFEFGLVQESLRERAILRRIAPHLVRPIPLYGPMPKLLRRLWFRVGFSVYDGLAVGRNIARHRGVDSEEMHRALPGLAWPAKGTVYHECRTDDARLTLEVARTASGLGALVGNHAEVTGLLGDERVRGARVVDRVTGESAEIRARVTVNATGVWAEQVHSLGTGSTVRLRPSKGIHLVFREGAVGTRAGVILPSAAHDKRLIFLIPWEGRVYAGTTDTEYTGDLADPPVTDDDRDYLLAAVTRAFPSVTKDDVVASWAGLRPLLATDKGSTADLSRKHAIYETPPGLITITGGKLTTFRAMAEELVDGVAKSLGNRNRSRTRKIPLGLHADLQGALARTGSEAERVGLGAEVGRRFVYRFGDDWTEALRLIRENPSLGEPAVDGLPVLRVELELARTREMALTDDDVLVRRTRVTTMDHRVREPSAGALQGSGGPAGPAPA